MSPKRLDSVGIKQAVPIEWYNYALDMLLAGSSKEEIRKRLDTFISERNQSGGYGERGTQTYTKAVTQIMKCWVTPDPELVMLRNDALTLARHAEREIWIVLHWAVTSAAYPFWQRIAEVTGRMLSLQEAITQGQIRQRCFELLGERTTIERSARRVIRTFVAWGVLRETATKGCYEKSQPIAVTDARISALLVEAALHTVPGGKIEMSRLQNSPGFFPFSFPPITGRVLENANGRLCLERYGLDEEFLSLANTRDISTNRRFKRVGDT